MQPELEPLLLEMNLSELPVRTSAKCYLRCDSGAVLWVETLSTVS